MEPPAARARLSGLLIGLELAGGAPYWLGQPVAIVWGRKLSAHYARALRAQGASVRLLSARDTVLAGLTTARREAMEKAT